MLIVFSKIGTMTYFNSEKNRLICDLTILLLYLLFSKEILKKSLKEIAFSKRKLNSTGDIILEKTLILILFIQLQKKIPVGKKRSNVVLTYFSWSIVTQYLKS